MQGHFSNQCALLNSIYAILNGFCTLHLSLRHQPENCEVKKIASRNVDAHSFRVH